MHKTMPPRLLRRALFEEERHVLRCTHAAGRVVVQTVDEMEEVGEVATAAVQEATRTIHRAWRGAGLICTPSGPRS